MRAGDIALVAFGWLPKAPTVDGTSHAGFLCPTSSDLRVRNAHGAAAQLVGGGRHGCRRAHVQHQQIYMKAPVGTCNVELYIRSKCLPGMVRARPELLDAGSDLHVSFPPASAFCQDSVATAFVMFVRSPAAAPSSGVGCKRLRFYQDVSSPDLVPGPHALQLLATSSLFENNCFFTCLSFFLL